MTRIPAEAVTVGEYRRRKAKAADWQDYAGALVYQCFAAGLPEPVREYKYAAPERKLRADLAWLQGPRLLVEIQGGVYSKQAHGSVTGILADNDRLNEATWHGWKMLRFTPDEVMSGKAVRGVERALKGEL